MRGGGGGGREGSLLIKKMLSGSLSRRLVIVQLPAPLVTEDRCFRGLLALRMILVMGVRGVGVERGVGWKRSVVGGWRESLWPSGLACGKTAV